MSNLGTFQNNDLKQIHDAITNNSAQPAPVAPVYQFLVEMDYDINNVHAAMITRINNASSLHGYKVVSHQLTWGEQGSMFLYTLSVIMVK